MPEDRSRPGRRLLVVSALVALLAVGGTAAARVAGVGPFEDPDPQSVDQLARHPQYNAPDPALVAAAKQSSADGDQSGSTLLTRLDAVPTGIWLTSEQFPTPDSVAAYTSDVVTAADHADEVPVFVLYAVPGRDCTGGESAGGLAEAAYLPWVRAFAGAAGLAEHAVAVLEPDALPGAVDCGIVDARVALLRQAVDVLRDAGVTTYIDAGHSDWHTPEEIAPLLERVGVESVRGFSLNVANYQPTADEVAYGQRLSALVGGAHFIVDTGRNGADTGVVDQWCNPSGQSLGPAPGYLHQGALDAYIWVKPPGESDGYCNGGPAAGQLWATRALELAHASGW